MTTPLEDNRKKQILDAAFSCFSSRGVSSVTMDEIAKEANLSKGALYWYFKSKDELILALCESWISRNDQALRKMAEECTLDELLFEYPRHLFRQTDMATHSQFFFQLWAISTENAHVRDRVASMYREHCQQASVYIRRAVEQHLLKKDIDAEAFSRQILALFDGLTIQRHYDPGMDLSEQWSRAIQNLLEGIGLEIKKSGVTS